MFRRFIIGALVVVTLVGAGIAIGAGADGNWGRHHDAVVISGTGTGAADAGQTIVVSDGHGPYGLFFFPFGLLFVVLFFLLVASAFRRGGRRGGSCRTGGPGDRGGPAWLEDWHRRAHGSDSAPGAESSTAA